MYIWHFFVAFLHLQRQCNRYSASASTDGGRTDGTDRQRTDDDDDGTDDDDNDGTDDGTDGWTEDDDGDDRTQRGRRTEDGRGRRGGRASELFRLLASFQTCPPAPGRLFEVPVLRLWDDISTCSAALGRHSSYPAALGRHCDLSCCSGMTCRPILLLQDDISTYPVAPGRLYDLDFYF